MSWLSKVFCEALVGENREFFHRAFTPTCKDDEAKDAHNSGRYNSGR